MNDIPYHVLSIEDGADDKEDKVQEVVNRIWFKYDVDRSGFLDRRETFRFVKDVLG